MNVAGLIQEIFDVPYFESNGALSDFTLQRGFNTHHVRVITRDWDFKVLEVLDRSNEVGKIKRTHYFKTLDELDLHLRNIRKGYPQFEFIPKFGFLL